MKVDSIIYNRTLTSYQWNLLYLLLKLNVGRLL